MHNLSLFLMLIMLDKKETRQIRRKYSINWILLCEATVKFSFNKTFIIVLISFFDGWPTHSYTEISVTKPDAIWLLWRIFNARRISPLANWRMAFFPSWSICTLNRWNFMKKVLTRIFFLLTFLFRWHIVNEASFVHLIMDQIEIVYNVIEQLEWFLINNYK
jgi:hypothetical protein